MARLHDGSSHERYPHDVTRSTFCHSTPTFVRLPPDDNGHSNIHNHVDPSRLVRPSASSHLGAILDYGGVELTPHFVA